jgi:hypothetical protein
VLDLATAHDGLHVGALGLGRNLLVRASLRRVALLDELVEDTSLAVTGSDHERVVLLHLQVGQGVAVEEGRVCLLAIGRVAFLMSILMR